MFAASAAGGGPLPRLAGAAAGRAGSPYDRIIVGPSSPSASSSASPSASASPVSRLSSSSSSRVLLSSSAVSGRGAPVIIVASTPSSASIMKPPPNPPDVGAFVIIVRSPMFSRSSIGSPVTGAISRVSSSRRRGEAGLLTAPGRAGAVGARAPGAEPVIFGIAPEPGAGRTTDGIAAPRLPVGGLSRPPGPCGGGSVGAVARVATTLGNPGLATTGRGAGAGFAAAAAGFLSSLSLKMTLFSSRSSLRSWRRSALSRVNVALAPSCTSMLGNSCSATTWTGSPTTRLISAATLVAVNTGA